jgi:hypothetical protein
VGNLVRWFLLTHEGRRALVVIYSIAAAISIAANYLLRGPWFALSVAIPLVFAPCWTTWCLRRPWPERPTS